jgi:hypothetical protein
VITRISHLQSKNRYQNQLKRSKIDGDKKVRMALQQITIEIPDKILLAERTDAESFGREIRILAAVSLFGWVGYRPGVLPSLQECSG